jgi:hypothetical protein
MAVELEVERIVTDARRRQERLKKDAYNAAVRGESLRTRAERSQTNADRLRAVPIMHGRSIFPLGCSRGTPIPRLHHSRDLLLALLLSQFGHQSS